MKPNTAMIEASTIDPVTRRDSPDRSSQIVTLANTSAEHPAIALIHGAKRKVLAGLAARLLMQPNAALSGSGPKECQETPWPVPAVRLNA